MSETLSVSAYPMWRTGELVWLCGYMDICGNRPSPPAALKCRAVFRSEGVSAKRIVAPKGGRNV
jgi:hypothetical protein